MSPLPVGSEPGWFFAPSPDASLGAACPKVDRPEVAGRLTVAGVPVGEGFLPLERITRRLLQQGLRRITFENVWAYSAPIRPGRQPLNGVVLGEGAFRWLEPPFDPAQIVLDQSRLSPESLVELEYQALLRGIAAFKQVISRASSAAG